MTTYKLATRGRYVEAEVNRNLVFKDTPNANSRTIKVTMKNIDNKAHTYTVTAVTGTENWEHGSLVFTSVAVDLEPGDVQDVYLDIANASITPPNPNASYHVNAVNILVDNATSPDVIIWPIWVLNTGTDSVAHVKYTTATKYTVFGDAKRTEQNTTFYSSFFIADIGTDDYLPASAVSGIIIAVSPLDRTAGVLEITKVTSQGPGDYEIKLNPITTGYMKVKIDLTVDYSRLGSYLGSAMSWLASLGADAAATFLNNKFIQHMFLATIDPFLSHHLGAQNITMDAYTDPVDSTKVHIVMNTYININDDPPLPLVAILALSAAFSIGSASISWAVVNVSRAEVQKMQIQTMREANQQYHDIVTNPNVSNEIKQLAAKHYGVVAATISQFSGVPACDGLAMGNTCVSWWVFAVAAALLFVLAIRK